MKEAERLFTAIQKLADKITDLKKSVTQVSNYQDISVASLHYLDAIDKLNTPTLVELSEELQLSKPSVTIMVNKMIASGHVIKEKHPEDSRSVILTLSDKGHEVVSRCRDAFKHLAVDATTRLTPEEMNILIVLLNKIS